MFIRLGDVVISEVAASPCKTNMDYLPFIMPSEKTVLMLYGISWNGILNNHREIASRVTFCKETFTSSCEIRFLLH